MPLEWEDLWSIQPEAGHFPRPEQCSSVCSLAVTEEDRSGPLEAEAASLVGGSLVYS